MNLLIDFLNAGGQGFVKFSYSMFVQSALLIAVLFVLDMTVRKNVRAIVRYSLWMLLLIKLILPAGLSSPTGVGYWLGGEFLTPGSYTQVRQQAGQPVAEHTASTLALQGGDNFDPIGTTPVGMGDYADGVDHSNLAGASGAPEQTAPVISADLSPAQAPLALTWQGVVFACWAIGVIVMLALLTQRMIFVRGLIRQSALADDRLINILQACKHNLGISPKRRIDLRISPNASSPAICGLFTPVILMPENLADQLDPAQLRSVFCHELIHFKRLDLVVNLIQTLLQVVYFYNPLLWAANAIIRRLREKAVDEAVLVNLGRDACDYSQTLLNVAGLSLSRPALSLRLIGVVESKDQLTSRIKHIINRPTPKSARIGIAGAIFLLVAAAVLLPMAKAEPNPTDEPKPDKTDVEIVEPSGGAEESAGAENKNVELSATTKPDLSKAVEHPGEWERLIEDIGQDSDLLIDFDTGKMVVPDKQFDSTGKIAAFMREHGYDAIAAVPQLRNYDMSAVMVADKNWEQMTSKALKSLLKARPVSRIYAGSPDTGHITYLIKTREGSIGLLRLAAISDGSEVPRSMSIKFKMLHASIRPGQPEVNKLAEDIFATLRKGDSHKLEELLLDGGGLATQLMGIRSSLLDVSKLYVKGAYADPKEALIVSRQVFTKPLERGKTKGSLKVVMVGLVRRNGKWRGSFVEFASAKDHQGYIDFLRKKHPQAVLVPTMSTTQPSGAIAADSETEEKPLNHPDPKKLIIGRVLDKRGNPLENVEVQIRQYKDVRKAYGGSIAAPDVVTNNDGYFYYEKAKWPYRVGVIRYFDRPEMSGKAWQWRHDPKVYEGPEKLEFILDDFPAGTAVVKGVAVDQDGRPLSVPVNVRLAQPVDDVYNKVLFTQIGFKGEFSNPDGSFDFSNIPAGEYRINAYVQAPNQNYRFEQTTPMTVKEGSVNEIRVTLIPYDVQEEFKRAQAESRLLSFRIAPFAEAARDGMALNKKQIADYTSKLESYGTEYTLYDKLDGKYRWFEVSEYCRGRLGHLVTHQFKGKQYVLLCTSRSSSMVFSRFAPNGWKLANVSLAKDSMGKPAIKFVLDKIGAEKMAELTGRNIRNTLAIVYDNKVVSAPIIMAKLSGRGQITGNFSQTQAREIANKLRKNLLREHPVRSTTQPVKRATFAPVIRSGEFYIMGDVKRPGVYSIADRQITIKMALAAAVLIDKPKTATLIRRVGENEEQIIPLDLQAILEGKEADAFLKPNDILAVGEIITATTLPAIRKELPSQFINKEPKPTAAQPVRLRKVVLKTPKQPGPVSEMLFFDLASGRQDKLKAFLKDPTKADGALSDSLSGGDISFSRGHLMTLRNAKLFKDYGNGLVEKITPLREDKVDKGCVYELLKIPNGKYVITTGDYKAFKINILSISKDRFEFEYQPLEEKYESIKQKQLPQKSTTQPVVTKKPVKRYTFREADYSLKDKPQLVKPRTLGQAVASPGQAIVFGRPIRWWASHWAGRKMNTNCSAMEYHEDFQRFIVTEPDKRKVWVKYFDVPVDPYRYPIVVLTYRARDVNTEDGSYVLYLDDTSGPDYGGIMPFKSKDIISDGKEHVMTYDLRRSKPIGKLIGLAFGVRSGKKLRSEFDLIDLRFEAEVGKSNKVEIGGRTITVKVVDSKGLPIAGADVTMDAERANWARTVTTGADGLAKVTPWKTQTGRHMIRVSKDNMVPVEVRELPAESQEVKVTLGSSRIYTGIVSDENDKPLADATVNLFALPTMQQHWTRRDAQVLTDDEGKWQSPPLPAEVSRLTVNLAHRDSPSGRNFVSNYKFSAENLSDESLKLSIKARKMYIAGMVTDEKGHPLSGAKVRASQQRKVISSQTDDEGKFAIELPGGGGSITVSHDGYGSAFVPLNPASERVTGLNIKLKPARIISGVVLDDQGKPIADATVRAFLHGGLFESVQSDKDGNFKLTSCPEGKFTISVIKSGYRRAYKITDDESEPVKIIINPVKIKKDGQRRKGYDPEKIFRRLSKLDGTQKLSA